MAFALNINFLYPSAHRRSKEGYLGAIALTMPLLGYVAGCCANMPTLRASSPNLRERGATCATAGVMGPVVAAIRALQAQMALSLLLGLKCSLLGQLVSLDAATWRMGGSHFDRA